MAREKWNDWKAWGEKFGWTLVATDENGGQVEFDIGRGVSFEITTKARQDIDRVIENARDEEDAKRESRGRRS